MIKKKAAKPAKACDPRFESAEEEARWEARRFKGIKLQVEITHDVYPLTVEQRDHIKHIVTHAAKHIAEVTGIDVVSEGLGLDGCILTKEEYLELCTTHALCSPEGVKALQDRIKEIEAAQHA